MWGKHDATLMVGAFLSRCFAGLGHAMQPCRCRRCWLPTLPMLPMLVADAADAADVGLVDP